MLTGRTVHVVPSFHGNWQVVDLNRHVHTFPNKTSAVASAKAVAESDQPSQVVLFDEHGRLVPIAHYQLPQYRWEAGGGSNRLIGAAVKAMVIGELVAAGAMVIQGLVDAVESDLKKETARVRAPVKRKRSASR